MKIGRELRHDHATAMARDDLLQRGRHLRLPAGPPQATRVRGVAQEDIDALVADPRVGPEVQRCQRPVGTQGLGDRLRHMVYASSSSVYGGNTDLPFAVEDQVDNPVSLYAATKKSDELMSNAYAVTFGIPLTGLRFFTVYGPWGRPDMAIWKFTSAILEGRPIDLYNHGDMSRDFTFIDDVAEAVTTILARPPADDSEEKPGGSIAPHAIYNLGNNRPERLSHLIDLIESACGREAEKILLPMQPGDVPATYANIDATARDHDYRPTTPLAEGIPEFVNWYRSYKHL